MKIRSYNKTVTNFEYDKYLIKDYKNWILLLNKNQFTFGSLVLICKDDVISFSDITLSSYNEMKHIIEDIESKLKLVIPYEKLNYLMLMMVDPNVHFHILPRYSKLIYKEKEYTDFGWPGKPNLDKKVEIEKNTMNDLISDLASKFN